ncbi:hypothetical protein [Luteolibacter marinus]|uniref:hypothetical protein n=1 Tax=Luteolibacter marinus TaxID=2776705 RepID=UPI00186963BA|nr:hypothetical protein [Luteolibacter marinus]
MPAEPPSSSNTPGRHRPALSDLSKETTEDDLWNLDETSPEIESKQPKPPPTKRPAAKPLPQTPEHQEFPVDTEKPSPVRPPRTKPLGKSDEKPEPVDEIGELDEPDSPDGGKVVTLVVPDEKPEPPPAPAAQDSPPVPEAVTKPSPDAPPAPAKEPKPRKTPAPETAVKPRMNRRELVGIAAFAVVLLAAAIWVLSQFFGLFRFKSEFVDKPDLPISGEHVVLAAAETFWREPVREGESRDVARREVVMIPVLEISLDPDQSPSGALRIIFRNGDGEPVGDSITRSFTGGRFDANGEVTLAFPATDGFLEMGNYNAYRTGKDGFWTAEVHEGPSINAPASQFKPLVPIPVFPLRR